MTGTIHHYPMRIFEKQKKIIEDELDSHNITVDTFSYASNKQKENKNEIFTSEKLNKPDDLSETLKDLKIKDAEYYLSNSANKNDANGDPRGNPKTVTHTSDGKVKVKETRNKILQKNLLSNRTVPAVAPTMDHMIENRIITDERASHTLLTPALK